jgi:hypothetical protein
MMEVFDVFMEVASGCELVGRSYCLLRGFFLLLGLLLGLLLYFGLAGLFFCILPVYLGAPYAFFNEISLLIKKRKKGKPGKRLEKYMIYLEYQNF